MNRHEDLGSRAAFEAWVQNVRDPAEAAALPPVEYRAGGARASYTLAPVPAGWTWQIRVNYRDYTGGGTPWQHPLPTETEAREAAINDLTRWLSHDRPGDAKLLALIAPSQPTLGF